MIEVDDKKDVTAKEALDETIQEFGLVDKYLVLVSDNAMKSTFAKSYGWISCNAHNMNLVLRHFFFNDNKANKCSRHQNEPHFFYDYESLLSLDEEITEDALFNSMFNKRLSREEFHQVSLVQSELKPIIRLILNCKRLVFKFILVQMFRMFIIFCLF